jgi:hypothetical protein
MRLEALAVDDRGAGLVVLALRDPHLLERRERGQDLTLAQEKRKKRTLPPIQTEYLRSGGETILTFIDEGARAVISFCIRSAIPLYMVVPPDMTMLP